MATAKPKVKRMMFGGAAKAAVGATKAVAAKTAPMKMQNAARSAAQQAAPKQMQFMSDMLRGAPMQKAPTASQMPSPLASLAKAYGAQKSGNMGAGSQAAKTGLGKVVASNLRGVGAAAAGIGRAIGMGKKKGGAVKKATKK